MPVSLSGEGVELAVLKKSEDGDALVVRIVETRGRRASCRLDAAFAAVATPVLANELGDLGGSMAMPASLVLRPFEIKTLRVERQQDGCCS
jgi:alpha-mannosidase